MRALILSAGLGERLRPLTLKKAKPAVEFLNMPMLTFPYYWLSGLGLTDLTFNTHYLPDSVRHAAMEVVDPRIALHFTHESTILGSGGGIWNARFHLSGERDFAVANGDGVVVCERLDWLKRMHKVHVDQNALATLLVCPLEGVGSKIPGVWMKSNGSVINFGKVPSQEGLTCLHFASFMIFNQRLWDFLPAGTSNILYDVLQPQIAKGEKVLGFRADDLQWFETGNVPDFLSATNFCLKQLADQKAPFHKNLMDILERHAPDFQQQSDLKNMQLIADSADLPPSVELEGFQVIGQRAKIGASCRLEDCVVLSGGHAHEKSSYKFTVLIDEA